MAVFYNIDYYLVNGLQRVIVLYNEEPPRITFILLDPIILVFGLDEEAMVAMVGKLPSQRMPRMLIPSL